MTYAETVVTKPGTDDEALDHFVCERNSAGIRYCDGQPDPWDGSCVWEVSCVVCMDLDVSSGADCPRDGRPCDCCA